MSNKLITNVQESKTNQRKYRKMAECKKCEKEIKLTECLFSLCENCCYLKGSPCSKHKVKKYNQKKVQNIAKFYENDEDFIGNKYRARIQSNFEHGQFLTASVDGINLNGMIFNKLECVNVNPQSSAEFDHFELKFGTK
ncbi:hypothetical protein MHBO_003416 [Bonamia ostreae]|uniref:Uncharacterized protein n=1 Tax=Bonamia ostreae TaxID=126728 RepID=A0ABV2AQD3_9EUKA